MLHFPSSFSSASSPSTFAKHQGTLNATQIKSQSDPLLLRIEEELHDARRVQAHGQEEDLRAALGMVINRVTGLTSMLNEAYKVNAELEVQLNVAKSNLQLVISNNEMLEEALKRESGGHSKDVGWRRRSAREADKADNGHPNQSDNGRQSGEQTRSVDDTSGNDSTPSSAASSPVVASQTTVAATQDNRFFRFRFTGPSSNSRPATRPTTPSGSKPLVNGAHHPASSSMPVLPMHTAKEVEDLTCELEKERTAREAIEKQKADLEAELESLTAALFEEANKMVATERIKRAETEEELREARLEQEALRSAIRLIEGENSSLRSGFNTAPASVTASPDLNVDDQSQESHLSLNLTRTRVRSLSQVAVKSPTEPVHFQDLSGPLSAPPSSASTEPPDDHVKSTDIDKTVIVPDVTKETPTPNDGVNLRPQFDEDPTTPTESRDSHHGLDTSIYSLYKSSSSPPTTLYEDPGHSPWADVR
ncbi:hypothetical protein AMATHDRAFT_152544 [Amanita thiersii Skay4041]|uniref:GDP/GTP exchange factor Sec2 N-terminal domain-containing protein n=1 Tax=Amanita thiersii Skay4041 TaxID=703135 RepID=A0A2A9NHT7_9AGAR|nr:hypothetical protein AMATHDRAFT_152544 [Amanita thiersii Skay4041]